MDQSLAALDQALLGNRKGAGRKLADLEDYCLTDPTCDSYTPYFALQRLLAAEWLWEAGEVDQAARLLRWSDAPWPGAVWIFGDPLVAPTYLLRARLEEARHAPQLAAEGYREFLRRYDRPSTDHAALVEEARAALSRLAVAE